MQDRILGVYRFIAFLVFGLSIVGHPSGVYAQAESAPVAYSAERHRTHSGDFNGDGFADVLLQPKRHGDPVHIRFSSGHEAQAFPPRSFSSRDGGLDWVAGELLIADSDGDGIDDIIVVDPRRGPQVVRSDSARPQRNPQGHFALGQARAVVASGVDWSAQAVQTGDFNGDGKADFLLQPRRSGAVSLVIDGALHELRPGGSATAVVGARPLDLSTSASMLHVGDFDGDSRDDVLVQSRDRHPDLSLLLTQADLTRPHMISLDARLFGPEQGIERLQIVDFDGNGLDDLWVTSQVNLPGDHRTRTRQVYLDNLGVLRPGAGPQFQACAHPLAPDHGLPRCFNLPPQTAAITTGKTAQTSKVALEIVHLTPFPNPCEVNPGEQSCDITIWAEFGQFRHDADVPGWQPLLSCLHDLSLTPEYQMPDGPNTIACSLLIDIQVVAALGTTTYVQTYFGYEIQRKTVTVVDPSITIPLQPGVPYFQQVEWTQYAPPIDTDGSAQACWGASNNVTTYEWQVHLATSSWPTSWQSHTPTASDQCVSLSLPRSPDEYVDQQFRVRACNVQGCSEPINSPLVTTAPSHGLEVSGVVFSGVSDSNTAPPLDVDGNYQLSWDAPAEPVAGYRWSNDAGTTWHDNTTTQVAIQVTPIAERQTRVHQVLACADLADCPVIGLLPALALDIQETQVPTTPSTIFFQQTEQTAPPVEHDGDFVVAWGAATGTVDGYRWEALEANTVVDSGTTIGLSLPQSVTVDGTRRDRTYRVQAYNRAGSSPWASGTLGLHAPPSAPGAVTYTALEQSSPPTDYDDHFVAHWAAASGTMVQYNWQVLWNDGDPNNGFIDVLTAGFTTDLNVTLTGLQSSTEREVTFQVWATNDGLSGPTVSGEPVLVAPPPPAPPELAPLNDAFNREGESVALQIIASDVNGDTLTFAATGLPPGLSLDSASGVISGMVAADSIGDYAVMVTLSDAQHSVSDGFEWRIRQPFGNGLQLPRNVQVLWVDESQGLFQLQWSYPQADFDTESGRADHFAIVPVLASTTERDAHPIDPIVATTWQAQWQSAVLDADHYTGTAYQIQACYPLDPNNGNALCGPDYLVHLPEVINGTFSAPTVSAQTSADPQAFGLNWTVSGTDGIDYYQINEQGSQGELTYYTEDQSVSLIRATAGNYDFQIQACDRDRINGDRCGAMSTSVQVNVPSVAQMGSVNNLRWALLNPELYQINWNYTPLAVGDVHSPEVFKVSFVDSNSSIHTVRHYEVLAQNHPRFGLFQHGRHSKGAYEIRACKHTGECGPVARIDTRVANSNAPEVFPPEEPVGPIAPATPGAGGPDELRPGEWFDPDRRGTGFTFYWANRLRFHSESEERDPNTHEKLYGNTYDLLAYWLTYRMKDGHWEPVWLFSQLKANPNCVIDGALQPGGCFQGDLLFPTHPDRHPGEVHENIGGMQVHFSISSRHARVYMAANGKHGLAQSYDYNIEYFGNEILSQIGGGQHDHYSGVWWENVLEPQFGTLSWLESNYESMTALFYDTAGDPVWARGDQLYEAPHPGPSPDWTTFNFFAISQGFDPSGTTTEDFYDFEAGRIRPEYYQHVGNGGRYYPAFRSQNTWLNLDLDFSHSDGYNRRANLRLGGSEPNARVRLEKQANFHDVRFFINGAPEDVQQCSLSNQPTCDVELTWFTDAHYPNLSVHRCPWNDPNRAHCVAIDIPLGYERWPTAEKIPYALGGDTGDYVIELRRSSNPDAPVIARSDMLTITDEALSHPQNPDTPVGLSGFTPPDAPPGTPPTAPPSTSANVGATAAGFSVNAQGAASYSIPILTAPATAGLAPSVSLNYSSAQGDGPLGIGWTIGGVSIITRCSQSFIHDGKALALSMDQSDRLCLGGQRLFRVNDPSPNEVTNAEYWDVDAEYRTEVDNLAKIAWAPGKAYLIARFPDGSSATYGREFKSRIFGLPGTPLDASNPQNLLSWGQDSHRDSAGNFIAYEYTHIGAVPGFTEFHLSKVSYTGYDRNGDYDGDDGMDGASSGASEHPPYAEIVFHYEDSDRPDPSTRWLAGGSELRQSRRIAAIESINNGITLRHYRMHYGSDGVGRSIVESIQECRDDSPTATCFGATEFNWGKNANALSGGGTIPLVDLAPGPNGNTDHIDFLRVADIDVDGRQDLVYAQQGSGNQTILRASISTDQGLTPGSGDLTVNQDLLSNDNLTLADVDADGRLDLLYAEGSPLSWSAVAWSEGQFQALVANLGGLPPHLAMARDIVVADVNGDGHGDLLFEGRDVNPSPGDFHPHVDTLYWAKHRGSVGGYEVPTAIPIPLLGPPSPNDWALLSVSLGSQEKRSQVGDINGDGLSDLLVEVNQRYCVAGNIDTAERQCSNDNAERRQQSWWLLTAQVGGDFAAELMAYGITENCRFGCDDAAIPVVQRSSLVDLNADGLSDWLYRAGNMWSYQLNSGGATELSSLNAFVGVPQDIAVLSEHLQLADVDGNGFLDLLNPIVNTTVSPSRREWQAHYWRNDGFASTAVPVPVESGEQGRDLGLFPDLNGDGRADYVLIIRNPLTTAVSVGYTLATNSAGSADSPLNLITRITDGLGGVTEIDYAPMSDFEVYIPATDSTIDVCDQVPGGRKAWCEAAAVYTLVAPAYLAKKVTSRGSPDQVVDYRYQALQVQAGGRGSMGFRRLWRSQLLQATGERIGRVTTYRQDYPYIGQAASDRQATLVPGIWPLALKNSFKFDIRDFDWDHIDTLGNGETPDNRIVLRPYIKGNTQKIYDPNSRAHLRTSTAEVRSVDTYGYPLEIHSEHWDITQAPDDLVLSQNTRLSYYGDNVGPDSDNAIDRIAAWQLGLVDDLTVASERDNGTCLAHHFIDPHKTNCVRRKSHFIYDERALLSIEIVEPNGNAELELTTTYTLDDFGNRTNVHVVGQGVDRSTTVGYDSKGRYVERQENGYGQTAAQVWTRDDYGNPTQVKDIYGQDHWIAYDTMGRGYFNLNPNGSWLHSSLALGNNPPEVLLIQDGRPERDRFSADPACPATTRYYSFVQGGGLPERWHCFDGQGRGLRSIDTAFDGRPTYTDVNYDALGRVVGVSEPFYDDADAQAGEPSASSHATTLTEYDTLSRTIAHTNWAGEGTTVRYSGLETEITQPGNVVRQEMRNVLGELVTLVEDQGQTGDHIKAETIYTYDAVGQLVRVDDADGHPHFMRYNVRGMRISLDEADLGQVLFEHNALGEVTRQWHPAAAQAIDFSYDRAGRLVERNDLTAVSTQGVAGTLEHQSEWGYSDTPTGDATLLSSRAGPSGSTPGIVRDYGYDDLGRLELLTTTIDADGSGSLLAEIFTEQVRYDAYGRLFRSSDASQAVFQHAGLQPIYNDFGYVRASHEAARPDNQDLAYLEILKTDARGNPLQVRYGNGVQSALSYDVLGRIETIDTVGADTLQGWSYDYSPRGNLQSRQNRINQLTETFGYDNLNRLKLSTVTNGQNQTVPQGVTSYRYSVGGKLACVGLDHHCDGTATTHTYQVNQPNALSFYASPHPDDMAFDYRYDTKGNRIGKSLAGSLPVNRSDYEEWIDYTAFNKPATIDHIKENRQTHYQYGPERSRYLRVDVSPERTVYTYYVAKHASGQRATGTFPRLSGGIAEQNKAAQQVVDDILGNADSTFTNLSRGGLEVRAPDGRGLRFNSDGNLSGFLDPRK